ncbi:hypothetical protein CPSG_06507 [Coccidioides posadasii str. Silveira]|uniref:Uncharacterized protein n=1 Tax=Coccidioides posadasii (strain RMSCC 757 / Silveira) TaxID=443226 RepID=E9D9K5_COCPS|nr:hypothetical protein CPSG_06507 [Coccidioides posadasii str. Silveira]
MKQCHLWWCQDRQNCEQDNVSDHYTVIGIIDWELGTFYLEYDECIVLTRTLCLAAVFAGNHLDITISCVLAA